jgi:hypothetical protein
MASLNRGAATISMIEAMLSILLAIYLLVVGIVTLRGVRSGGKLHWAYVALKIPLVILAIVVNSIMAASIIQGAAATGGGSGAGTGTVVTMWIILLALAALAYPLSLVVVLLTKTVRRYYGPARDD